MKAQWIIGALAALAMACGSNDNQGRVAMEVGVSNLTADQNFCFTWQLHQLNAEGEWYLVDEMQEPVCGQKGEDTESALGTCYGDQRFLITYNVSFFNAGTLVSQAVGTSGGGERDLCVKNHDTSSSALFQFGNEGNVGGVNPGIEIDQVCANDKIEYEDGRPVSALWLQGDACGEGLAPDSFCALGQGWNFRTSRVGVTDGNVRYVFTEADPEIGFMDIYYLAFEPTVPAGQLILQHNPWRIGHYAYDGYWAERWTLPEMRFAYRYDAPDGIKVGFLYFYDGDYGGTLVHDGSGDCNGALALDSQYQWAIPNCTSGAKFIGAVAKGGSAFDIVFQCVEGGLAFLGCDAQNLDSVCELPTTATDASSGPMTVIR